MSFDIHFQRFEAGDAGAGGGDAARKVLGPYLQPSEAAPERLERGGSEAEIYGLDDDSMMITHVDGDGIWDLLVEAARAARWTIMPVGCPVCVFSREMLDALPHELDEDAVIISSGADLRDVIVGS